MTRIEKIKKHDINVIIKILKSEEGISRFASAINDWLVNARNDNIVGNQIDAYMGILDKHDIDVSEIRIDGFTIEEDIFDHVIDYIFNKIVNFNVEYLDRETIFTTKKSKYKNIQKIVTPVLDIIFMFLNNNKGVIQENFEYFVSDVIDDFVDEINDKTKFGRNESDYEEYNEEEYWKSVDRAIIAHFMKYFS